MKKRDHYKPDKKNTPNPESGNVLFFILIAVVLFGALSFVVGNMMRGGSAEQITEDRAKILASGIIDYGNAIRQAMQNIRISNGCSAAELSFETPSLTDYTNVGTRDGCKIFSPAGGDLSYIAPSTDALASLDPIPDLSGEWYFTGGVCAMGLGQSPTTCTPADKDIVAYLPYLNRTTCLAINDALSIDNPGGNPPREGGGAWASTPFKFNGSFAGGTQLNRGGAMTGCFEGNNATSTPPSGTYHFFQILYIQ
jgi:hypothetical protein